MLRLVLSAALIAATLGDYPTATPPKVPPESLRQPELGCPTCPWDRPELGTYPPPFNAPPGFKPTHRGKYFDVYGHWIENRYSEVFWTAQPAVPLPADVVSQFAGKAIAITGFEVDVVAGGENNETEWSVPEFQVYNHHYCATIRGAAAKMTFVGDRAQDALRKGQDRRKRRAFEVHPPEWEPRDMPGAENSTIPTAQNFWMGNGGEHRKSFKSLPVGVGQLIASPQEFVLQPMLINTNNPAQPGQSPRQAFHAAPLPKTAQSPAGANYSGLMECPCTTRTQKVITGFNTKTADTCGANGTLGSAVECFEAAGSLVSSISSNLSSSDPTMPSGCFLLAHADRTDVHWNTASSAVPCGAAAGTSVRSVGTAQSLAGDLHLKLDLDQSSGNATITLTGPAGVWFGVGFNAAAMADLPYTIVVDGTGAVQERKLGNHMPGTALATTVEVLSNSVGPAEPKPPVKMNHRGDVLRETGAHAAEGCKQLCDDASGCGAWTFLPRRFTTPYNVEDGTCQLRSWAASNHGFCSDGWIDGMLSGEKAVGGSQVRTVVLSRPLKGASSDYFSFDPRAASVPFIEAVGTSSALQYHGKSRGGGAVMMVEGGAPVCVCKGGEMGGSINGIPWSNNCEAWPATTIARDHNPSCSIESYGGGMICCHHEVFLLDAEQSIPTQTFRHRMKFRFYYEDPEGQVGTNRSVAGLYPGLSYQNAFFMFRETEVAHGEYDVPKCPADTPPEECVHTIVGNFQIRDAIHQCNGRSDVWCSPVNVENKTFPQSQHVAFVHISPHCHGPACISMQMINADTNETLCYTQPHYGTSDAPMNEAGYAAGIPPCLWGTKEEGLPSPPIVSLDTNITVVKKVNSTNAHFGVMGHWQMRAIWAADPATQ